MATHQTHPTHASQDSFLLNCLIDDVLRLKVSKDGTPQSVIEVSSDLLVGQVLEHIGTAHITSVPVYDEEQGRYLGWFGTRDLVSLLLHKKKEVLKAGEENLSSRLWEAIRSTPVREAVNMSGCSEFRPVPMGSPLISALVELQNGAHRVPVVDFASGRVRGVISQTDIINELSASISILQGALNSTLEDLGMSEKRTISINNRMTIIQAFRSMHENRLSALPVVDASDGEDSFLFL